MPLYNLIDRDLIYCTRLYSKFGFARDEARARQSIHMHNYAK